MHYGYMKIHLKWLHHLHETRFEHDESVKASTGLSYLF